MKVIADYVQGLERGRDCLGRVLKEWRPDSFERSEKEQEQALQTWLQVRFPDVPIVSQYGIARGKADLVIQDTYVIELKLGFSDESLLEFDRCIGQLERYRQKWVNQDRGPVFLVVVGKSETEFRDMLHKAIEQLNRGFFDKWFYLIEKLA